MTAPQLEDHAVLFLDILGFSKLVKDGRLAEVFEAVKFPHDLQSAIDLHCGKDVHLTAFSDSIVVSIRMADQSAVNSIVFFANYLFMQLLSKGVLTRGALTIGPLHHKDGIVFGKGLVEAAELEKHVANYPRIVLSGSILNEYQKSLLSIDIAPEADELWIRYDFDNVPHVNVFGPLGFVPVNKSSVSLRERYAVIERLVTSVMSKRPTDDPRVAAKYDWLLRYYRDACHSKIQV